MLCVDSLQRPQERVCLDVGQPVWKASAWLMYCTLFSRGKRRTTGSWSKHGRTPVWTERAEQREMMRDWGCATPMLFGRAIAMFWSKFLILIFVEDIKLSVGWNFVQGQVYGSWCILKIGAERTYQTNHHARVGQILWCNSWFPTYQCASRSVNRQKVTMQE